MVRERLCLTYQLHTVAFFSLFYLSEYSLGRTKNLNMLLTLFLTVNKMS